MSAEEEELRKKAEQVAKDNAEKRKELLEQLRAADLADVKEKCKLHGFTASELRGYIKTRGAKGKTTGSKTVVRRSSAKKKIAKAA
jgi:hypothetical protein